MTKRVDIIGSVGVPASYGGFETLVENLVADWQDKDLEVRVYCSAPQCPERHSTYKGAKLIYVPLKANGVSSILYDIISIMRSSFSRTDTLLVLGVSGAPALVVPRLLRKRIVTNVDGLEWQRDKWGSVARFTLRLFERIACAVSHKIVADNAVIGSHVHSAYGRNAALIAYGADHVTCDAPPDPALLPDLPERYAVKVCRIEPENNIDLILDAFKAMPARNLVIVGNWNSSAYGTGLRARYGDCANIMMVDPIYHIPTISHIRARAQIYVHGHSAGGTNPSLVEAMYLGLPVLAFACGYNEATTHDRAAYFKTADDLAQLLAQSSDADLQANGQAMKALADTHYLWAGVAQSYRDLLA
jgi:glycosyltransferase involved in cell wall biosynthesis